MVEPQGLGQDVVHAVKGEIQIRVHGDDGDPALQIFQHGLGHRIVGHVARRMKDDRVVGHDEVAAQSLRLGADRPGRIQGDQDLRHRLFAAPQQEADVVPGFLQRKRGDVKIEIMQDVMDCHVILPFHRAEPAAPPVLRGNRAPAQDLRGRDFGKCRQRSAPAPFGRGADTPHTGDLPPGAERG